MQVSKTNLSIMRPFASLNIRNSLNTKVQKQNETKIKKLQINFNRHQVFLDVQ